MAIRANATSIGVRVTRSYVRNGMTRTRGVRGFQPRSAKKCSRIPHRTSLKAKAKVCSPQSKSYIVNITLYEINRFLKSSHKLLRDKGLVLFPKWPNTCGTKTTCPLSVVQVSLVPEFRIP